MWVLYLHFCLPSLDCPSSASLLSSFLSFHQKLSSKPPRPGQGHELLTAASLCLEQCKLMNKSIVKQDFISALSINLVKHEIDSPCQYNLYSSPVCTSDHVFYEYQIDTSGKSAHAKGNCHLTNSTTGVKSRRLGEKPSQHLEENSVYRGREEKAIPLATWEGPIRWGVCREPK